MSTVCHPPFGEAAAEDGVLCALAGDIIHPNPPSACGDKSTGFLADMPAGRTEERQEHRSAQAAPGSAGNSQI